MLISLPSVLDPAQLSVVQQRLAEGRFVDGKQSAGEQARRQKNNQELSDNEQRLSELNNLVMGALLRHPVYLNAGLPSQIAAPYYARYQPGMHYGSHVDDPVMGQGRGQLYRADVAITLFLNPPEDYDGGELSIQTTFGPNRVKLAAGDGVMYPASSLHEVLPVTRGERLVAVTWMQSLVAAAERRELLYELYQARELLRRQQPDSVATRQVDHSYLNLIRMWSNL